MGIYNPSPPLVRGYPIPNTLLVTPGLYLGLPSRILQRVSLQTPLGAPPRIPVGVSPEILKVPSVISPGVPPGPLLGVSSGTFLGFSLKISLVVPRGTLRGIPVVLLKKPLKLLKEFPRETLKGIPGGTPE